MLKWHIYVASKGPHVFLVVSHSTPYHFDCNWSNPGWLKQPSCFTVYWKNRLVALRALCFG